MDGVLIVGAGPVGLTLAAELARYGVQVRLIDRSPYPTETSKALVVWSRTLELMDRMGCTPAFLDAGLHPRGASIRNGRTVLRHTGFDTIASSYNFALMLPQRDTERLLNGHLRALRVTVEREVELLSFSQDPSRVDVVLRHADGQKEAVETPWLIGGDGAHSTGSGTMPRFILFSADKAKGAALAARFPGVPESSVRAPPEKQTLLIVRPDGCVELSGADQDWTEAERYLHLFAV